MNGNKRNSEIVRLVHSALEWHQDMAEDNVVTLQSILNIFRKYDIYVEGGWDLQEYTTCE